MPHARSFSRHPPADLYARLVAETCERISRYDPSAPYAHDALFWDTGVALKVEAIPRTYPELFAKARFLGGVLFAVGALQRRAAWDQARIESEAMVYGDGLPSIRPAAVFARVLQRHDPDLQRTVAAQGIGSAAVVLRKAPDVDLHVARDLGCAEGYPERLPIHPRSDRFATDASARVCLFWSTAFPVPVYPVLAAGAALPARELQPA